MIIIVPYCITAATGLKTHLQFNNNNNNNVESTSGAIGAAKPTEK
jgi:hypothetical protein